ncbi:MAG: ATP-binding cassette domain-containing protein [Pontibacterium sp.]
MRIKNLSFGFEKDAPPVLRDINLVIKAGEAIAITGTNGVGKSTFLNLLNGLLEPSSGEVQLDGKPLTDYDAEYLRFHIGYAPQSGVLYEGTILENMTLFRHGEVIDQALMLAKHLGLDGVIARLPEGFDTRVGGATVERLSAAVKQQILMIRALVGNPRVMLLDDTNACFDLKSDAKLLNLLMRVKGQRTLVVVTARPSFMRFCDRAFELQDGRLTELRRANQAPVAKQQEQGQ